jgi:hypothetical protein
MARATRTKSAAHRLLDVASTVRFEHRRSTP